MPQASSLETPVPGTGVDTLLLWSQQPAQHHFEFARSVPFSQVGRKSKVPGVAGGLVNGLVKGLVRPCEG